MNEIGVFKRITVQREEKTKILRTLTKKDIAPSVILFLVSRALPLGMSPFSVAMFAAVYDKRVAYMGVIAAVCGLLSAGTGAGVMKYIFAMVLFWLYTRVNEEYKKNSIMSSVVCGVCVLAGGLATVTYMGMTLYDFMMLLSEAIISAFMYIAFESTYAILTAGRKKLSQEEIICFCVSVGAIVMGFSGVILPFGTDTTKLLSAYAVMLLAMNTSLAASGAGALATGMICGVNTDSISSLMGLYGFCAIMANMLKGFGKYGVMLGFLSGCAVIMLCEGTSLIVPIEISEIIGAIFMFIITPDSVHKRVNEFFAKCTSDRTESIGRRVKDYLSERLIQTANAFSHLAESFHAISENRLNLADVTVIFDDTAERVCKNCGMSTHCWQRGFNDTYKDIFTMLSAIEKNGSISVKDMPKGFCEKCVKAEKLVNCFSHMYELYKERMMWASELAENRDLLADQYKEISAIMTQFADEAASGFEFMEELEKRLLYELDKAGISADDICAVHKGEKNIVISMKVYGQYSSDDVCAVVSEVMGSRVYVDTDSTNDKLTLISGCGIETDIGIAQACKTGERDNGDSIVDFAASGDKVAVAISDGMGSGSRAMVESSMTTELLERFVKAGFDKNVGINIINSSLALRSAHECFSTVDLLVVDKNMANVEFIKAGAPESYIMSGENIETVFSASLPAGMVKSADVHRHKRDVQKGDVIVMMSDGVSDAGKSLIRGEWIKKKLMSEFSSAQELADMILDGAIERSHMSVQDDMSVAVVRII